MGKCGNGDIGFFAWEEELARECVELLSYVVLQGKVVDRWVWRAHSSNRYTMSNAYQFLIDVFDHDVIVTDCSNFNHILWL